ncbi:MAG: hypothetical protein AMXMBFR66_16170 [Pseudomonadota bacterium]|nr:DUF1631 family protein [Rubrivivax sp.]
MPGLKTSPALEQYIDGELLRAPLLFDQVLEGALEQARRALPTMSAFERAAAGETMHALNAERERLTERFVESLRAQVRAELSRPAAATSHRAASKPVVLALVEEEAVALEVEQSHLVQLVKSTAEHELRELASYIAALVGDLDVAEDHNPFRPESHVRALWDAAQGLALTRGHRMAFMRWSGTPLAHLLRQSYAAACARLEGMGVEPAAYRTVIQPGGTRRSRGVETTFAPDLQRMRETMPAPLDAETELSYQGQAAPERRRERWREVARTAASQAERQSIELVSRLFDAVIADERVPEDVSLVLSRLHGPAMRLALRDPSLLDKEEHPLWRLIDLLAHEAQMAPDIADPERRRLLRLAKALVDQLAAETEQRSALYRRALQNLEEFLRQRLARRCAAVATQIGALQKHESRIDAGSTVPAALDGVLDAQGMDTVPAELLPETTSDAASDDSNRAWLEALRPGHWVRLMLHGRWVAAQLLWPGEKGQIWLFGDGATDATWAIRRRALLMLHGAGLAKSMRMRSLVGSAARRVQERLAGAA